MLILAPEWARQRAVIIAWPQPDGDFSPLLSAVEDTFCRIARAITQRQGLIIICHDSVHQAHIERCVTKAEAETDRITYVHMEYNDIWVRDTAPLTVYSQTGMQFLDFQFNGWGGKYECAADSLLGQRLHATGALGDIPMTRLDFILEGGSIESDGEGTLMTTSSCLLNRNRNASMSKSEIEEQLKHSLGADRVLWLTSGAVAGDDTDCHVDTLARFCDTNTIAYCSPEDSDHPDFLELMTMKDELQQFRTRDGEPYKLVPLPMPTPVYDNAGHPLPGNYANFLIINDAVLVPTYNDPMDKIALARLAPCFPGRQIIDVPCTSLIHQFGSLHCMTMQIPEHPAQVKAA